jgi:hypothetical protein
MTAWVLVLAGVAAGDGGMGMGAATAPVAVDLGGRWVGTCDPHVGKRMTAELHSGVLRIGSDPTAACYRFPARPAPGLEGQALLVANAPVGRMPVIYRLERGRLVICCSLNKEWPKDFNITPTTVLLTLKPAARKP